MPGMEFDKVLPWIVLTIYIVIVFRIAPRSTRPSQFFGGDSEAGIPPGVFLLGVSAAMSWVMAKSVDNTMNLTAAFGLWGGIGYATYWAGFVVAGVAVYFLRVKGGFGSLAEFLTSKYGGTAAKAFLVVIAIRVFNEVWSNTKVTSLYFGPEGSAPYWTAALVVTGFTVLYSWRGGLRSSILTDGFQMVLLALLLACTLAALLPGLAATGIPSVARGNVTPAMQAGGITFFFLALVQTLSYPFHDPVLTDRAFVGSPAKMLRAFIVAAIAGGGVILLFSVPGLYALAKDTGTEPSVAVAVPKVIGVWLLLVFNGVMLTSAGSTLDSTFSATAKFAARDWPGKQGAPDARQVVWGRRAMVAVALVGNLPLLGIYWAGLGPAVVAATTISGTAVMGLAPIFLLAWVRRAGAPSFHFAFWPGVVIGVIMVIESTTGATILPAWVSIGEGKYAQTLGVNIYGLGLSTLGYLVGTLIPAKRSA